MLPHLPSLALLSLLFTTIPLSLASEDTPESVDTGSSGHSAGSVNLSTSAQIAIIVIVSIVVILGVVSAVLFYLAKKRQWKIRASFRRSTRRLTGSFKPRGGRIPESERAKRQEGAHRPRPQGSRPTPSDHRKVAPQNHSGTERKDPRRAREVDLEKADRTGRTETRRGREGDLEKGDVKAATAAVSAGRSSEAPQAGWKKVLGFGRNNQ